VIGELARRPTRPERKNGWVEETRSEFSGHLQAIRTDIADGMTPDPRELPSQVELVRALDAFGVALGDPLSERVLNAFADARRYAKRA
jgi:hypothetical protein